MKVKNFLFHRVSPQRDPMWDPMDPKLFDQCLTYIKKNYDVVLLEDFILSGDYQKKHKNKIATILFDDGYKDNLEYAAPILKKHHLKASFYVVTDCIEKNVLTWTHVIDYTFYNTQKSYINFNFDFFPPEFRVNKLETHEKRVQYAKKFRGLIRKITHAQRMMVMNEIYRAFDDVEFPKLMMNWDEVRQLRSERHYIGSHTVSHAMLGTMKNVQEMEKELKLSAEIIEKQMGYFPVTISYPVGSYNQTTIDISKKVGYSIGLAVHQNIYDTRKDSIFEIPRIELYNESWLKTYLRITNYLEDFKRLIGYRK